MSSSGHRNSAPPRQAHVAEDEGGNKTLVVRGVTSSHLESFLRKFPDTIANATRVRVQDCGLSSPAFHRLITSVLQASSQVEFVSFERCPGMALRDLAVTGCSNGCLRGLSASTCRIGPEELQALLNMMSPRKGCGDQVPQPPMVQRDEADEFEVGKDWVDETVLPLAFPGSSKALGLLPSDGVGHLVSLRLSGNKVGDRGCDAMARFLTEPCGSGLEELFLDDNRIGDDGCAFIASALSSPSGLRCLDLSRNRFRARGCSKIAEALTDGSRLEVLVMRSIGFGPSGTRALAPGLAAPSMLLRVDLRDNALGEIGKAIVCQACGHRSSGVYEVVMIQGNGAGRCSCRSCILSRAASGSIPQASDTGVSEEDTTFRHCLHDEFDAFVQDEDEAQFR